MSKRIYVAYVGGTIGMKATDSGYAPVPGHLTAQVRDRPELTRGPELTITEYEPLLDSANARPSDWLRIARDIAEHRHHYDGFVVLHGTDTMAYTASALAFLLRGLGKPVIITGSQIPLGVLRSDGRQNFLTAVLVAARDDVSEVCLVFGSKILRGARAVKASASGFEAFVSPNLPPLGEAGVEIEIDESRLRTPEPGDDRAAAQPRRAGRRAAALPGDARRAAARGDGGAGHGPGARGLRRRHRPRCRSRVRGGARRARRRGHGRQPVRRRPGGPRPPTRRAPRWSRPARSAGST